MPKFIVTSGSHFEPYSYDELVKPVMQAQEAYNAAQEAYDTMNVEANSLDRYISNDEKDSGARALYDRYMEKLNNLRDELWSNGITPMSKRMLSQVRAGFASDIKRLEAAIQARQDRSKEYWDAVHSNPDLVVGTDPGISGLNDYLKDDNFGRDYYSYSGNSFMKEVAVDAQARASELMKNLNARKDPSMPGYLIVDKGFTGNEVNNASSAVREVLMGHKNASHLSTLSDREKILADVLMTHITSSGAIGNIDSTQLDRLIDYGRKGLSAAIGDPDIKDDKVWAQNQAWNQFVRQKNYVASQEQAGGKGYTIDDISSYLESSNSKKISGTVQDAFVDPFKTPVIVHNNDGTTKVLSNPMDAEKILNSFGKEAIYNSYGIDPSKPSGTWTLSDGQGGTEKIKVVQFTSAGDKSREYSELGLKTYDYLIKKKDEKGQWQVDVEDTLNFNRDLKKYRENRDNWRKNNNDVDIEDLAISVKDRQKIYDDNNIPYYVPFEYVRPILEVKQKTGRVTPATIVDSDASGATVRNNYTNNIVSSFARVADDGKVSKTSEAAFYPVKGYDISDTGKTSLEAVFGDKAENKITEITVLPEDLLKNRVRISVGGSQYAINPAMLGNNMDHQIRLLENTVPDLMMPLFNPEAAVMLPNEDVRRWIIYAQTILGSYFTLINTDKDGNVIGVNTPKDIVLNADLRDGLRRGVTLFMNDVIAEARDSMAQDNMQSRGNSSSKALSYNEFWGLNNN